MKIHQVLREYADEDGVWRWWTALQPEDVITGRTVVSGTGQVFVEVEHQQEVARGFWRKPAVRRYKSLYAPSEIRHIADVSRPAIPQPRPTWGWERK